MRASHLATVGLLAASLALAPSGARADQRERPRAAAADRGRAVPRAAAPRPAAPQNVAPRAEAPRAVPPRASTRQAPPAAAPPRVVTPGPAPRAYAPAPPVYAPSPRAYGYAVPRGSVPYRYPYRPPGYAYGYRYAPRPYLVYPAPYGWRPYGYGPGWNLGFYFGRPYAAYGYGYSQAPAYGYYAVSPSVPYGALRIVDAPPNAQVFVDGYYAGVVDDYDGVFQHLNLEVGAHRIELEVPGYQRTAFDVRILPGQTITYRAGY